MAEVWIAILDANGVLVGFDENPSSIPPDAVTVPAECTLRVGEYRWDGTTFWPLYPSAKARRQRLEDKAPAALWLLIREFKQVHPTWIPPAALKAWYDAYKDYVKD